MNPLLVGIGSGLAVLLGGLVVKYFWDKWNKDYVTLEHCKQAQANCPLKNEMNEQRRDLKVVKEVVMQIAEKMGIPFDERKGLIR
ncbi:MAG: hypothetical protein WC291_08295 [Thermodesulfovibrionales bacterium]|jgi:hypothetical protein